MSSALLAVAGGDISASADMSAQQKAARSYAKQAAQLLGGEHRLALKAAAELRATAAGIHVPGTHRFAAAIRSFASGLISKRAVRGNQLEIAALDGFGSS